MAPFFCLLMRPEYQCFQIISAYDLCFHLAVIVLSAREVINSLIFRLPIRHYSTVTDFARFLG